VDSLTVKLMALWTFHTSGTTHPSTLHHSTEVLGAEQHHCENLTPHTIHYLYRVFHTEQNLVEYHKIMGISCIPDFSPYSCFMWHQPVTQQDCARNTCVCSVYDMTRLLYESDGCRGYSGCRNLPPSAKKANESSWTQHNISGNSQVFGR
jgi:hypothetical protein